MAKTPFAWSYSSLDLYETCPKKFYHTKIKKDYKEDFSSPAAEYGKIVHKAFELRLLNGKKLPLDLTHHERAMKILDALPGENMPEQRLALNIKFEPTGYFDSDVWVRGQVDYAKYDDKAQTCLVVDHKTGRMKDSFDQVELMTALFSAYVPEVKVFIGAYYWTKEKHLSKRVIPCEEIPDIWSKFLPRVTAMQEAIRHDEFPAKQNGLCRRFCGVKSCPYNGG